MRELRFMNEYELAFVDVVKESSSTDSCCERMLDALLRIRSWRDYATFCSKYAQELSSTEFFEVRKDARYVATSPIWRQCPDPKKQFKFGLAGQLDKLDNGVEYLDHSCFEYRNQNGTQKASFLHEGKCYRDVSYRATILDLAEAQRARMVPESPFYVIETRSLFEVRDFFELLVKLVSIANKPSLNGGFVSIEDAHKVPWLNSRDGGGLYAYPAGLPVRDYGFLYPDIDESFEEDRLLGQVKFHRTLWGRVLSSTVCAEGVLFIGVELGESDVRKAMRAVLNHPQHYGLDALPKDDLRVVVFGGGLPDEAGWLDYDHGVPRRGEAAVKFVCWALTKTLIERGCGRKHLKIAFNEESASTAFNLDEAGDPLGMLGEAVLSLAQREEVGLCEVCKRPIALLNGKKSSKYCGDVCKTNASAERRVSKKINES